MERGGGKEEGGAHWVREGGVRGRGRREERPSLCLRERAEEGKKEGKART